MDRKRIHIAATGRRASDVNQRMNRRMKAYAVGIVVILTVLSLYGPDDPGEMVTLAEQPLGPVDIPGGELSAPLARIDPSLLSAVADGTPVERSRIESVARQHLIRQAGRLIYGDLAKLGLQPGSWDELVAGAAEQRGQAFWTLGTLSWWENDRSDGYPEIRGEVLDREGHSWAFLAVSEPTGLAAGDVVKLAGFYLKAYELLRPDGSLVTAPLLVADEILPSAWPIEPVTALPEESLQRVRDFDITQASRPLNGPGFYELLSFMDNAAPEQALPTAELEELLPTQLLVDPSSWRGRPVSLTGVLYYKAEQPLGPRGENPLGIPFAWNLWVSDNRAGEAGTMLVICLDEPVQVKQHQIVTIEGRFFRRFAFENQANAPRMAAVIVASRVTPFTPATDTLTPLLSRIILSIVGVVVLALVLGQWREHRSQVLARTQRMRRHRANLARPGLLSAQVSLSGGQQDVPGSTGKTPPSPPEAE